MEPTWLTQNGAIWKMVRGFNTPRLINKQWSSDIERRGKPRHRLNPFNIITEVKLWNDTVEISTLDLFPMGYTSKI